jgi:hypothetical protein
VTRPGSPRGPPGARAISETGALVRVQGAGFRAGGRADDRGTRVLENGTTVDLLDTDHPVRNRRQLRLVRDKDDLGQRELLGTQLASAENRLTAEATTREALREEIARLKAQVTPPAETTTPAVGPHPSDEKPAHTS